MALGWAVLGQLAALYFTTVKPQPWLAGIGFALAFGNRTELILTAPLFTALLWQTRPGWRAVASFSVIPMALGLATLGYNAARFGSPLDFGYGHIPGVLNEPWYRHGIFSLSAIPYNIEHMLLQGWRPIAQAPYYIPAGFGGSILLASPFFLALVHWPTGHNRRRLAMAALATVGLTIVLWLHGNPGGVQYSYRYGLILLPWLLVWAVEVLPANISRKEIILLSLSVGLTLIASYLFLATDLVV